MPKYKAYAKVNLYLNVLKKVGDLHRLDGIYIKVPFLYDEIEVAKRNDSINTVTYSDGRSYKLDNGLKAANLFVDTYHTNGCDFYISKNIPEMCGLGGSSADAGCVFSIMEELYLDNKIPTDILLSVGSDVPFCKEGKKARVRGVGESIEELDFPDFDFLIVDIFEKSNTKDVYAGFDRLGGEEVDIDEVISDLKKGIVPEFKNSLTRASVNLCPRIGEGLDILRRNKLNAGMTGSGSALFFLGNDLPKEFEKMGKHKIYNKKKGFVSLKTQIKK
ncbi:MAG: hypothetical protein K5765_05355 [Clostridia bacterium]|nr:hypothetical protein [Clostridia bacterium]